MVPQQRLSDLVAFVVCEVIVFVQYKMLSGFALITVDAVPGQTFRSTALTGLGTFNQLQGDLLGLGESLTAGLL